VRRLAAIVVACTALLTGCWTQVGFGPERTSFNFFESTITTANVASLTRAWTVDVGSGATSPVVLGGSVFVSSTGKATALDVGTGATRWQTTADEIFEEPPPIRPLTFDGRRLLATFGFPDAGGTLAYDVATGAPTGSPGIHHSDFGSIASDLHGTNAFDTLDFAPTSGPFFHTLRYGTRRGLIEVTDNGFNPATDPAIVGEHVVIGLGGSLLSFPLHDCIPEPAPIQNYCAPEWTAPVGGTVTTPVGLNGARIAVGDDDGDVTVLDATDGAVMWKGHTGTTGATAPAYAYDTLYVGAGNGRLYAFDGNGCGAAVCSPLWSAGAGAAVSNQPAVAAGVVYVGTTHGRVKAFAASGCGAPTCPSLWTGIVGPGPAPGAVNGPVVANGAVYASTTTGHLAAFRLP
jgi:outer membrane protein assembly factor BamB